MSRTSPNPYGNDTPLIIATCKWILGEVLRAESSFTFDETAEWNFRVRFLDQLQSLNPNRNSR